MPTYDYRCDANGQVLEVTHRMSETLTTWGDLCERAGVEPGGTPPESPVHRLATGGNVIASSSLGSGPACGTGACCPTGVCGLS
jgi:hypothetical protein